MKKNTYLFKEFNPVSAKEWKQLIQMDLKGADYNKTLVWNSLEGIDVKPFYHPDNFEFLEIPTPKDNFKITQSIFVDNPEVANKIALDFLSKGADAIIFKAEASFDIDILFQGFSELKNKPVLFFKLNFQSGNFTEAIINYFEGIEVHFLFDILGNLASTGNWQNNETNDFNFLNSLVQKFPSRKIIQVDASIYQNAGANIVQQVAYALSHANQYIMNLGDNCINRMQFNFAIGSNYFFEIAKIRAFRYLWKKTTETYHQEKDTLIMATPSLRNKTLYDYNVNMLRTGTEYMSAVLGGADFVNTLAYDAVFKKSNAFSSRIARNQLLIMKEENGFNKAQDYTKGSYYIESLSIEIAKKALALFKLLEKSGGYLQVLKSGKIQEKIKESAYKEQELFNNGKINLLGTNKYPNPKDKMKDNIELFPFYKKTKHQTRIQPIVMKRLAENMEQKRMESE